ncbi:hypothetical protein EO087_08435 [Dyella sp. M7H15-1]|uniref:hypothetical protein n=1 Tax=Dyella sp. M7H15-1 TaxID=2501295 RepID=UPI001004FB1F|nr:hypothetical protein [Dyella sp. M7H15-1]QAU24016.1 hypothetical protein EO087_08435 [Dyella sp. M7H15-1]
MHDLINLRINPTLIKAGIDVSNTMADAAGNQVSNIAYNGRNYTLTVPLTGELTVERRYSNGGERFQAAVSRFFSGNWCGLTNAEKIQQVITPLVEKEKGLMSLNASRPSQATTSVSTPLLPSGVQDLSKYLNPQRKLAAEKTIAPPGARSGEPTNQLPLGHPLRYSTADAYVEAVKHNCQDWVEERYLSPRSKISNNCLEKLLAADYHRAHGSEEDAKKLEERAFSTIRNFDMMPPTTTKKVR